MGFWLGFIIGIFVILILNKLPWDWWDDHNTDTEDGNFFTKDDDNIESDRR